MPVGLAPTPTIEELRGTTESEYDNIYNVVAELVHYAIAQCVSPDLIERQTNLATRYDHRHGPIGQGVHIELGRLGTDGPLTSIGNVEHIRDRTSIGLGAIIGRGTIIKEHVSIGAGAKVGDFCLLAHHVSISDYAEVSTGVGVEYGIQISEGRYIEPGAIIAEWEATSQTTV